MKDNLYKALESIALGYSEGNVSVDYFIKACDVYKQKINFVDDFDYQIKVSKSFFDSLNGISSDEDIRKAIMPGQTKVIDGVMYIYSPTRVGSKIEYDWHVVGKGTKTGKNIGRGASFDDKKVSEKQKFINSLFPKDLSSLTPSGKSIGGSTGAQLMKDVNGNEYIMKRGKNTNNDHVKSEYLANQLYDILGLNVPQYELYNDKGDSVLLSKFIPMCKTPQLKDYKAMAKGFIADCLLANWDVYQNDNCLIDPAGRVIRVDNGGALDYKARGSKKPFDENILGTFKSMIKYNQSVYSELSDDDVRAQIKDIRSKRDDIINFLKESKKDDLADIIEKRIDGLSKIEGYLNSNKSLTSIPILPRNLKSKDEMYRDISEEELKEAWDEMGNKSGFKKLFEKGENGWELLSKICKLRGFDARPQVVTEEEYWKLISKDKSRQFFRGVEETNKFSVFDLGYSMLFDDNCFYGRIGVYGEGIYAHKNNGSNSSSTESTYKNSSAWQHAEDYTGSGGLIYKGLISPDANIVKYEDVKDELSKLTITSDPIKARKLQQDISKLDLDAVNIDSQIKNSSTLIEKEVYSKMKYDPAEISSMQMEIDNTDWGKKNAFGEREIPSFDDFVVGKMGNWVKAQGGNFILGKGVVKFTLPDSDNELSISTYQYDGPFSIKQKNAFSPAYNFAADMFSDWMYKEKVAKVEEAVKRAQEESSDRINKLLSKKTSILSERMKKESELKSLSTVNEDDNVWSAVVANKSCNETVGVYAALKGYDAIEVKNGNGSSNNFYVILNRSKLIISNKIDVV